MNTCIRSLAALAGGVIFFSSALLAQRVSPEAGMIGKRYAGGDFHYDHFMGSALDHAFGAAAVVNVPVSRSLDLMVGYSYLDTSGRNFGAIDKTLNATLLTHHVTEYGTGYFAGTLGHGWNRINAPAFLTPENGVTWGLRAGSEFAVGRRSAINAGVAYADAFDRENTRGAFWRYYVEGNHWFSADFAGVISINYRQLKASPDAIGYTAGVRWAF